MKIWDWESWGIKARMSVITFIPIAMVISIMLWSYHSRLGEIHKDLEERGHLIAFTLAQSSQYGVISGNIGYLEHTVQNLLKKDKGIFRIEIQGIDSQPLINFSDEKLGNKKMQVFEAPIIKERVELNPFDVEDAPHVSADIPAQPTPRAEQIIGYVGVTMSPSAMLEEKRTRVFISFLIAGVFLSLSILVGILLARSLTKPLLATISALRRIREGKYDIHMASTTGGEIGVLQSTIVDMANSLHQLRQNLEAKVTSRTHDLEVARDEALKSNEEKRRLIKKINTIVEEERKSIAAEVHDHLNASLIITRLEAQKIFDLADENFSKPTTEEIKKKATSIMQLSHDLYTSSRNMIKRLRPEIIDMLGLRAAVEEIVDHYTSVCSPCQFTLHAKDNLSNLSGDLAITAYRLIQESLLNIVKHAEAKKVSVRIKLASNHQTLFIQVSDDGKGFSLETEASGIGLIGMKERVASLNGKIKIRSSQKTGTRILIAIPTSMSIENHI